MSLLWINGQLIDKSLARVSPFDHGFLYGDGVWEPLRVFGGKLFRPEEHLNFLFAAAGVLGMDIPLSQAELLAAIDATVKANNRTEGYIRVIVTRGPGTIGPDPRKLDPQVIIIAEEYQPFPAELYEHGLHVVTAPRRVDLANPIYRVRLLGRPDIVQAKRHALTNGCLEALLIHGAGCLAGCTEGAPVIVSDGVLKSLLPSLMDATCLAVLELAQGTGLKLIGQPTQIEELLAADEAFLAGTSCGVISIVRVDGTDIGTRTEGPITREVRRRYLALTRGGIG